MTINKILLIAHRGLHDIYTENTLDAVKTALKHGATHVEIDIRKTADGKLVLSHDPITFRLDHKFTLIKKAKISHLRNKRLKKKGKITTLDELLSFLSNKKGNLVIEPKIKGIEKEILLLIDKYNFWKRSIVWSFNHNTIKNFTKLCNKRIKKAILITIRPIKKEKILERALDCGADFVYPVFRNLDINYFNNNGIGLIKAYNNYFNANEFINSGGLGIMTDRKIIIKSLK